MLYAPSSVPDRQLLGWVTEDRASQIHKTKPGERCKFATQYTRKLRREQLTYFDDLGFSESELASHKNVLCEYCFFGGPDKVPSG